MAVDFTILSTFESTSGHFYCGASVSPLRCAVSAHQDLNLGTFHYEWTALPLSYGPFLLSVSVELIHEIPENRDICRIDDGVQLGERLIHRFGLLLEWVAGYDCTGDYGGLDFVIHGRTTDARDATRLERVEDRTRIRHTGLTRWDVLERLEAGRLANPVDFLERSSVDFRGNDVLGIDVLRLGHCVSFG